MKKVYLFASLVILTGAIACNNSSSEKATGGAESTPKDSKPAPPSNEPEGLTLMSKSDCGTCHTADTKIVGPAYKEIAAKYPNTPENIKLLSGKVMAGGSGVWGTTPMGGHPGLAQADADKMVGYILSLADKK